MKSWHENINNLLITYFYESWIYDFQLFSPKLLHGLICTKCRFVFADMPIYFYRKSRICKFKIRENMWWARHKYIFCVLYEKIHVWKVTYRNYLPKIVSHTTNAKIDYNAIHVLLSQIHEYWDVTLTQYDGRWR